MYRSAARHIFASFFLLSLTALPSLLPASAWAEKLCVKTRAQLRAGKAVSTLLVSKAPTQCGRGFVELLDTNSLQGQAGATGPAGEPGKAGPIGAVGPTGATGETGPTGPTGAAGAPGPTGPGGPVGPMGPSGPIGLTGPMGPTGEAGPIGPKGPAGETGPAGPVGPTGEAGPEGPVGPAGPAGPVGPEGPVGPTGPTGPMGVSYFYGNSTEGYAVTTGSVTFDSTSARAPVANFGSFSISSGATLRVTSGTTIRVNGPCSIDGKLVVMPFASGGRMNLPAQTAYPPTILPPHPGLGLGSAAAGDFVNTTISNSDASGGRGALGFTSLLGIGGGANSRLLFPTSHFGGGGAGALAGLGYESGYGGGALRLLCSGALSVGATGSIIADGADGSAGSGGGGGGLVLLASRTQISMAGAVSATGGAGGAATTVASSNVTSGPGGGGAGGILIFVSPSISVTGNRRAFGAPSGPSVIPGTIGTLRSGGGGGGGGFLHGGNGGMVFADGRIGSGLSGYSGTTNDIIADPEAVIVH
jgi:hypothetical protein